MMKLVILTKKHIITASAAVLGTALVFAGIFATKRIKSVSTFSMADINKEIISRQLGDRGTYDIKKITGIDPKKPESIIKKELPAHTVAPEKEKDLRTPAPEQTDIAQPEPSPEALPAVQAPQTPLPENVSVENRTKDWRVLNNATDYEPDMDTLEQSPLPFALPENGAPMVLIVHTHTTEAFCDCDNCRSTDGEKNMVKVGRRVCELFNNAGISAVHDTTVHDYPSFMGAYTRSLATVTSMLEKYPSIRIVLDLHRDSLELADGTVLKLACDINGQTAAQVMTVAGTDSMGLYHPYWRDNLIFAAKIQKRAQEMYPGLMRPLNLRTERFNQHATRGSLILEIGGNGNTMDEALRAADAVTDVIVNVIKNG